MSRRVLALVLPVAKRRRVLFILACIFAFPVHAQTVIDGDTIKLDGTTYRIHGIDAPETHQICDDGYPAGIEATAYLRAMMRDRRITCEPKTTDRYGRTVALCRADGMDLGEAMVRAGMAWAFTRYSRDYELAESAARFEGRGVHGRNCKPAWEQRRER
ncbi:MAG: thermonuclease family protein [Hyphomonadaceae bacterium]|nr:thermonuclease family protein [Hyphomonadaceae bacterium]